MDATPCNPSHLHPALSRPPPTSPHLIQLFFFLPPSFPIISPPIPRPRPKMGQCSVVLDALTTYRSLYSESTMADTSSWCPIWPSSCPLWIASHAPSDAVCLSFSPPGDIGVSKQPHISSFTKPVPNHDIASARSCACSSDSAGAFGAPRPSFNEPYETAVRRHRL